LYSLSGEKLGDTYHVDRPSAASEIRMAPRPVVEVSLPSKRLTRAERKKKAFEESEDDDNDVEILDNVTVGPSTPRAKGKAKGKEKKKGKGKKKAKSPAEPSEVLPEPQRVLVQGSPDSPLSVKHLEKVRYSLERRAVRFYRNSFSLIFANSECSLF
jgi:hypothetical protein